MSGARLAPATLTKKLRYIESLYLHADALRGNGTLDRALANLDEVVLAELLESWFVSIRNQPAQNDADEARWRTGLSFVQSIVTWLSRSMIPDARLKRIEERLHRLSFLYDQLHIRPRETSQTIRSLPANVVSALYDHLDPVSLNNPFSRENVRWHVYLAFFLLLHQGLRRAELLQLPVDAIKSSYDNRQQRTRYWLNVQTNPYVDEDDDPRYSTPSIKTVQSIRPLPVSEPVAKVVQTYVENYRGQPDHSYLLNSQKNKPLSTESITKLFAKLFIAVDDLYDRDARTRLDLCRLGEFIDERGHQAWPVILTCGPSEFAEAFKEDSVFHGFDVHSEQVETIAADEAEEIETWYRQRTGRVPMRGTAFSQARRDDDGLFVSLAVELAHGNLESFARRFGERVACWARRSCRLELCLAGLIETCRPPVRRRVVAKPVK